MRVLFINTTCGRGSHGKICVQLAKDYISEGHECRIAFGRENAPEEIKEFAIRIGGHLSLYSHVLMTRAFDMHGLGSVIATSRFLKWAEKYDPDLLWLHNIHGYYLNYQELFEWIKSRPNMKVRWTLHDCWPITGHCTNFESCKCLLWQSGCHDCIQTREYPESWSTDRSKKNYIQKKKAFHGVKDMEIYTPSEWLAKRIRNSYLGCYSISVMPNPINHEIFRPRASDFRKKYGLEDKFIVLGVANAWQRSKGLYELIELSQMLDNDCVIVLVGLNDKQMTEITPQMIGIKKTNDAVELAQIYSASDVFVNPSREETFGMTAYEALLCGTKAVVYKGTACEEIALQYGGIVIDDNIQALYQAIIDIKNKRK